MFYFYSGESYIYGYEQQQASGQKFGVESSRSRIASAFNVNFQGVEEASEEQVRELRKIMKDDGLAAELATYMAVTEIANAKETMADPLEAGANIASLSFTNYFAIQNLINPCDDAWPNGVAPPEEWMEVMGLAARVHENIGNSDNGDPGVAPYKGMFTGIVEAAFKEWDAQGEAS